MTPATEHPNLSLYGIETQLMELLQFRESVAEDPDMMPAEIEDSLTACDRQIEEYVRARIHKVDGVAAYLRECRKHAEALAEEAKRITAWSKAWKAREERLERVAIAAMQSFEKTRIEGQHSILTLRKNPPSTNVRQPDLVPAEYIRLTIKISKALLDRIQTLLMKTDQGGMLFSELLDVRADAKEEISNSKILAELKAGGSVPGCDLVRDKVRLEVK